MRKPVLEIRIELIGGQGAGKSTYGRELQSFLAMRGFKVDLVDGVDNDKTTIRATTNKHP